MLMSHGGGSSSPIPSACKRFDDILLSTFSPQDVSIQNELQIHGKTRVNEDLSLVIKQPINGSISILDELSWIPSFTKQGEIKSILNY